MEDHARLRRKDTTKGPPLRILSLDGGGVRGYSMLIILQELMHRTFVEIEGRAPKRHEIPKPADHFDLIAGTGTGGLIAIMLGRLRLDIDTCKDLYVRLTRRVFETDKTIAGIPYKSTLFKASKLEEAIREVVREHTLHGSEGNDAVSHAGMTPDSPRSQMSGGAESNIPSRTMSQTSRYSQVGMSPVNPPRNFGITGRWGNANALLYDAREARTKTAVTAMFAGKRSTGSSVMLRSYDSRKEPASDVNCTIWQAGRATSATGLAFKPIQIGQTTYHDEGSGKFNPAPQVLDEAVLNEWPGREVGVFVSIGTGKRPSGTSEKQHEWWEGFMGGTLGNFAEARRRLIAKIEGCEDTHQYMMHEHLGARHVSPENYYRLNVEVGVGEFGMNEWDRLGDISTGTRMYLGKSDVQSMNLGASAKLARVHFAKKRLERTARGQDGPGSLSGRHSWQNGYDQPQPSGQEISLPSNPMAVELPGSDPSFLPAAPLPRPSYEHRPSVADMKYTVVSSDEFPQPAEDLHNTSDATTPTQQSYAHSHHRSYSHNYHSHNPSSATSLHSPYQSPTYPPPRLSADYSPPPAPYQAPPPAPGAPPPPLPPKTPLPYPDDTSPISPASAGTQPSPRMGNGPATFMNMGELRRNLPYPVSGAEEGLLRGGGEGPPPSVNMRSKPSLAR